MAHGTEAMTTEIRLAALGELNEYERAGGSLDVRGWDVVASGGERLGAVCDLLVDPGARRVRYLEVELDRDLASGPGDEPLGGRPSVAQTVGLESATEAEVGPSVVRTDPRITGELDKAVDRGRHVLIPIGSARVDEGRDQVILDDVSHSDLGGLPDYEKNAFNRDYETGLRRRFDPDYRPVTGASDFYSHALFDEDRFFGTRRDARRL